MFKIHVRILCLWRWMSKMPKRKRGDDPGPELKKKKLLSEVVKRNLAFLKPGQENFNTLMKEKYYNFAHELATCVPKSLQEELSWALNVFRRNGYFYRDWVKVKGQTFQTPVSRTLVGDPGTTYKYLGLRLFTIPWSFGEKQPENETELACWSIGKLNEHYKIVSRKLLLRRRKDSEMLSAELRCPSTSSNKSKEEQTQVPSIDDGTNFNVALINYMNPHDENLRLKPEPYYGMGPLAVSWHMDGNLIRGSTVAVYNHTCTDENNSAENSDWMVGFKVSWDVETPGVAIPLQSGESYFMLGDLNDTHQHCVIAGSHPRFSSTHRVADSCKGTIMYIQQQCKEALNNLTETENGCYKLKSLDTACLEFTETVHNEVEFEWLRQFWMQGSKHAEERKSWIPAMEDLESDWFKMEHMTKLAVEKALHLDGDKGTSIAKTLLPHLQQRKKMRRECIDKFPPRLCDTMDADFQPIHRPMWDDSDPSRPLTFDLSSTIKRMKQLCRQTGSSPESDSGPVGSGTNV